MRNGAESNLTPPAHRHGQPLRFLELALRLLVIPLTVASLVEMVSNREASDAYGGVEFSNLSGFKYMVCINAIAAVYSLGSVLTSRFSFCSNPDWVLFPLDQVMAYVIVTSGAAVAEVMYLAEEGDKEVSWSEVCSIYGRFCNKAKVSLTLHSMALACFIALSLLSAFRVFSKYEPPSPPCSMEAGEQGK